MSCRPHSSSTSLNIAICFLASFELFSAVSSAFRVILRANRCSSSAVRNSKTPFCSCSSPLDCRLKSHRLHMDGCRLSCTMHSMHGCQSQLDMFHLIPGDVSIRHRFVKGIIPSMHGTSLCLEFCCLAV